MTGLRMIVIFSVVFRASGSPGANSPGTFAALIPASIRPGGIEGVNGQRLNGCRTTLGFQ